MPSLADALPRLDAGLRELASADGRRQSAAWFLDPTAAPWCRAGCKRTALFWSGEGYTGVVVADGGQVESARTTIETWWNGLAQDLAAISVAAQGSDSEDNYRGVPAEAVKRADQARTSGTIAVRGDRVSLAGQGDPAWLALVLHADLVGSLFGDAKHAAP